MQLGRFNGTAEFVLNVCDLTYVAATYLQGPTATVFPARSPGPDPDTNPGRIRQQRTRLYNGGTGVLPTRLAHSTWADKLDTNAGNFFPALARDHLNCRLDEAVDIVRLICASQLAFV